MSEINNLTDKIADLSVKTKEAAVQKVKNIYNYPAYTYENIKTKYSDFIDSRDNLVLTPEDILSVTAATVLQERCMRDPSKIVVDFKLKNGKWSKKTAGEMLEDVQRAALGLIAKGVKKGDVIAIMSHTSYDWMVIDYANFMLGAITVPIYETSSEDQIRNILVETDTKYLFVENNDLYNIASKVFKDAKKLKQTYIFDNGGVAAISAAGKSQNVSELEKRIAAVEPEDVATIIFTSGSTGEPKGIVLSHRAFINCCKGALNHYSDILLDHTGRILLFLPLSHGFARFAGCTMILSKYRLALTGSLANLLDDIRYVRPTLLMAVPRIFEKVYNAASQKAGKGIKGIIFARAAKIAVKYSMETIENNGEKRKINPMLRLQRAFYYHLVLKQVSNAIGGKVKWCVSGSAPLNPVTQHFFYGAGIEIFEGYGLTEAVSPIASNKIGKNKIGTVGQPLNTTEFKIADDGEILIKSTSAFSGYFKDPASTKKIYTEDGFIKTGDLGEIDSEGYIIITGRKKNIIVTAAGKNIAPEPLEIEIEKNGIVENCLIIGDEKPFIGAVVTLNYEILPSWLEENELDTKMSIDEAVQNAAVIAEVDRAILQANKLVSRAESIRKFVILPVQYSLEEGTLTNAQKVCRPVVLEKYNEQIERAIYKK